MSIATLMTNEGRLTLPEAGKLLLNGKGDPTSPYTIRRYINDGLISAGGNRVKLEGFKVPAAGLCTTKDAIARFIAALNDTTAPESPTSANPSVLAAEAELAAAGIN